MNPAYAQLIIFGIEELITLSPQLYAEIKALFSSDTPPTAEQFAALRSKIAAETYEGFVPATQLPPMAVLRLADGGVAEVPISTAS